MLALGLTVTLFAAVPEGSIDEFIEREMPRSGAPGLAYAVVTDGEVSASGARGVLRLGEDREVTSETPFLIGSITKSITALAVMQLVEAEKVELDDEVATHLPVFSESPAGDVTIRQLLSHTSGYSTKQGNPPPLAASKNVESLSQRVAQLALEGAEHTSGVRWEYSNANYHILGRVIEVVSGQDFDVYVESNLLEPMGMQDSFVGDGAERDAMAVGHRPWFGTKVPSEPVADRRRLSPAGGVVASAHDLALYMQVMMNGRDDVLSAAGKAEMMQPASEVSPFYGFGWFVDAETGTVWHDGTTPGVETLASMVPEQERGVVVLVNAGSGLGFGETAKLRQGIASRALGVDYDDGGGRWSQKFLFISLTLAPFLFLLSMAWAWLGRDDLRQKSGAFGLFSLWFPLLTTTAGAWVILGLVPKLFGVPISTLRAFQPDFGLILIASAVTGVVWAIFRLGVAYSGKPRARSDAHARATS